MKIHLHQLQDGQNIQSILNDMQQIKDHTIYTITENLTVETDEQTQFSLVHTPNTNLVTMFINGMTYVENADFTVDRTNKTLTWTSEQFDLDTEDNVSVQYNVLGDAFQGYGVEFNATENNGILTFTIDGRTYNVTTSSNSDLTIGGLQDQIDNVSGRVTTLENKEVDLSAYLTASETASTYATKSAAITGLSISDTTVTVTHGDGTTNTLATKDTTYGTGTDSVAGITKLYTGTGANVDGAITQAAVTTLLGNKVNTDDLTNYYTKTEVNNRIDTLPKMTFGVVDTLPTENIDSEKIYLVRNSDESGTDLFTEYIRVNNTWEILGSQRLDLSGYLTISQHTTDMATKANVSDLPSTATDSTTGLVKLYGETGTGTDGTITQAVITNALNGKANLSDIPDVSNFITNTVNDLTNYYLKTETYTKTEVDNLLPTTATGLAEGLTKVYNNVTDSNSDGTVTQAAIKTALNSKANASDLPVTATDSAQGLTKVYTAVGTNTDGTMSQVAIKNALDAKLNVTDVPVIPTNVSDFTNDAGYITSSNLPSAATDSSTGLVKLYTATGTNTDGAITQAAVTTALAGKANTTDIPDVSSFITASVSNLVNYYVKNDTYTKTEVDSLISALPKMTLAVVNSLPTENIDTEKIYLVRNSDTQGSDLYTEYININGTWEILGSQRLDLSGYLTTTQYNTDQATLSSALSSKANVSDLPVAATDSTTGLVKLYTTTGNGIDGTMNQNAITTALSGKVNTTDIISTAHGGTGNANGTIGQLTTPRSIDGINFNGTDAVTHYGVSTEAAAAKTVNLGTNFVRAIGSRVTVNFMTTNTADNPTLNVSGTGAAPIYYRGYAIPKDALQANSIYDLVFTASNRWEIVGSVLWTEPDN